MKLNRKQKIAINKTETTKYHKQLKAIATANNKQLAKIAKQPKQYKTANTDIEQLAQIQVATLNKYIRQGNKGINLNADVIADLKQQACILILQNPLSLECLTTDTDKQTAEQQTAYKAVKNGLYRYYYSNYMSHTSTKIANNPSSYIATAQYIATDDINHLQTETYNFTSYDLILETFYSYCTTEQKEIFTLLFVCGYTQTETADIIQHKQAYISKELKKMRQTFIDNGLDKLFAFHN